MNFNHLRAIARKEFLHIIRDPGTWLAVTVGPIFLMVVFTYTMTADVIDAPVAIVDHAENEASAELIDRLDAAEVMEVTHHLETEAEADPMFERSEIVALVSIPANYGQFALPDDFDINQFTFTEEMLAEMLPQVNAVIDGTEPVSGSAVLYDVYQIADEHTRETALTVLGEVGLAEALEGWLELPIKSDPERLYNPDLRAVADVYPGLAAMMLSLPAMALAMSLARENERGTLEQLVATPIDKKALLVGKMVPYLLFGILDIVLLLALGEFFYDVPFRGSLLDYGIIAILFMISNLGIGLMIAVVVRSQQVAMILSMLVFFVPPFFLSGLFFPAEAMPWIVQLEMIEFPATHYVTASKAIYLQGASIVDLWFPTLILFILAVELIEIAAFIFRKKVIITFSWRKLLRLQTANDKEVAA